MMAWACFALLFPANIFLALFIDGQATLVFSHQSAKQE